MHQIQSCFYVYRNGCGVAQVWNGWLKQFIVVHEFCPLIQLYCNAFAWGVRDRANKPLRPHVTWPEIMQYFFITGCGGRVRGSPAWINQNIKGSNLTVDDTTLSGRTWCICIALGHCRVRKTKCMNSRVHYPCRRLGFWSLLYHWLYQHLSSLEYLKLAILTWCTCSNLNTHKQYNEEPLKRNMTEPCRPSHGIWRTA